MPLTVEQKLKLVDNCVKSGRMNENSAITFIARCERAAARTIGLKMNQPKLDAVGEIVACGPRELRIRPKSVLMKFDVTLRKDDGTIIERVVENFPRLPSQRNW